MLKTKTAISEKFCKIFKHAPEVVAVAPGRIEVLGNHTDYNEGFVLSAATDLSTAFAVRHTENKTCRIYSFDIDSEKTFQIDDLKKAGSGDWSSYIKGIVYELSLIALGKITGFEAAVMSSVPLSAGMSSSAALEISSGFALGKLFGIDLTLEEWAKLGQRVENNYLGLKSGLLDQFSSIYGEKDKLILCDFRKIKVLKTVSFPSEYVFVIVNSMIKHNLVDSDYNSRRESCERAVQGIRKKFPEVKALRDVSLKMLNESEDLIDFFDYKRAMHIVSENNLVKRSVRALENDDIEEFGSLLFESHESSRRNFENSCPELDYLIELAETIPGCAGARLSGGGFGGISIHLVKKTMAEQYRERIVYAFKLQTGIDAQAFICGVGAGAKIYPKLCFV